MSVKDALEPLRFHLMGNEFCAMVINDTILDEILNYLDNSMKGLVLQQEFLDSSEMKNFFESQYDIRLENLLRAKSSGVHQLESGLKNKVIMRKQRLLETLQREI